MNLEFPTKIRQLYNQVVVFVVIFTIGVITSLSWNIYKIDQQVYKSAEQSARISYKRDRALRHFLSKVGGVYLARSEYTDDGSFIGNFPNKEIFDLDSGIILTLYDPASLIKLMQQDDEQLAKIPVRIIGSKPLNPDNNPIASEQKILAFLADNTEFLESFEINDEQYLRLMKPLYTEQRCLKCHGQLGFKVGDMIGAVGVTVSMTPFLKQAEQSTLQLILTHGLIWLLGILGTGFYTRKLKVEIKNELQLKAEIQAHQDKLEIKVEQRTLELSRFSRAIENSPVMVIITDLNGIVEYVNPRFCEVTGYLSLEIIGKTTAAMKSELTPDSVYKSLWKTIAEGGIWTGELCNKRKDGSEYWVSASISPILSNSGEVVNYVALEEDISDKKHTQQELIRARETAEKASQAKSEFLARMSHELRTPLNAIIGFAQLFEYAPDLDTRQKNNATEIHKAGKHLLSLINHVLDLNKIEMGKIEMVPEAVLVDDLVGECSRLLKPLTKENKVNLFFSNRDCGCRIYVDYTHAKQVLINLLSNAIKYNSEGGRVEISCEVKNENLVRLNVKDSGNGIANEDLEELFEPYNRLSARASGIEGAGIGLVITKQLVELMGGHIGVESKESHGSVFWLELPIANSERFGEANVSLGEEQSSPNKEHVDNINILYIEDDMANVRLMQQIVMIEKNWQLRHSLSAEAGLSLAKAEIPDIILLDINLPGMDGFEALECIKMDRQLKTIPVIAVSADAMKHDIDRAIKAGFDAYITKPVNVAEIIKKIYTFL